MGKHSYNKNVVNVIYAGAFPLCFYSKNKSTEKRDSFHHNYFSKNIFVMHLKISPLIASISLQINWLTFDSECLKFLKVFCKNMF